MFEETVLRLTTPDVLEDYLKSNFRLAYHEGSIAYSPEEFFNCKEGDCKDYAAFASYVLACHDYYTRIVTFTWYDVDGERNGHVIVYFKDSDGKLRYMSNGQIVAAVESLAGLFKAEKKRLKADRIEGYFVLRPGTTKLRSP